MLATVSISALPIFSEKALSQECPFDSYIIVGGRCHNMTVKKALRQYTRPFITIPTQVMRLEILLLKVKKKNAEILNIKKPHKGTLIAIPNKDIWIAITLRVAKSDRDGYACDNLTRLDDDILTPAIWNELLSKNIHRKQSTKNVESLSRSEVIDIIGFYPNASKGSRTIWSDPINNMSIQIRFHEGKIMDMKGIGF